MVSSTMRMRRHHEHNEKRESQVLPDFTIQRNIVEYSELDLCLNHISILHLVYEIGWVTWLPWAVFLSWLLWTCNCCLFSTWSLVVRSDRWSPRPNPNICRTGAQRPSQPRFKYLKVINQDKKMFNNTCSTLSSWQVYQKLLTRGSSGSLWVCPTFC